MNSAKYRFITLVAILSLLNIGKVYCQTAVTGGIEGNVTDPSSASVPGAEVDATNTETDTTDANGVATSSTFTANGVVGGPYTVTAAAARS